MGKREKRLREILRILSQADKLDVSDIVIDMIYSILIHAYRTGPWAGPCLLHWRAIRFLIFAHM